MANNTTAKNITQIEITPDQLNLSVLEQVFSGPVNISLAASAETAVNRSVATVAEIIDNDRTVYGINTGFGLLANTKISIENLAALQRNLVLSHAAGTGQLMDDNVVRLLMVLKINALARGYSGIRWQVISLLVQMVNAGVYPCIPEKGSVGASGDLAPLAHMAAAVIGVGEVRYQGEIISAEAGLAAIGQQPITLAAKEGLALLNGTQASTAFALRGYFSASNLLHSAVVTGGLSVDALKGSDAPFDARIHEVRGQLGQITIAKAYRDVLAGSEIRHSHLGCDRVQDPYSLRCQPQVMGACLDHLRFAGEIFEREANAVSDNPLVFPEQGDVLSGGNFHAEPVAMAADVVALVISEIGAIAERRIALLVDPALSGLPAFLVENGGLNSGFMIAQVTSAALASENKSLAHPASVDSLPTSANQEDHVSMATFAARRLHDMAENTAGILAIEFLAAAQGIDFHRPLKTSAPLEAIWQSLRDTVGFYKEDRFFAPDIAHAKEMITGGKLTGCLAAKLL